MTRIWLKCLYYFLDWRLVPDRHGHGDKPFRLDTRTAWALTKIVYGHLMSEREWARR